MRLHIPDHLQKTFRSLMNLSYDLKKRHPGLKHNVKFDDDTRGLYMDVQTSEGSPWRRIEADQAARAESRRTRDNSLAPSIMSQDELDGLLEENTIETA